MKRPALLGLGMWGLATMIVPVLASAQTPAPRSKPAEDKNQPVTVDADKMERYGRESWFWMTAGLMGPSGSGSTLVSCQPAPRFW